MANLSYKTRGSSSPQGKERVYFTCHPEDFKAYFEPICEDIFRTQNCAIWYRADTESDTGTAGEKKDAQDYGEEMNLDLGQMQLFVIPITSRFLYQPSRARDADFEFALEHHIPILPLMQEQGLESEFNRICGDLQFLDKKAGAKDPTALPYDEKLKKFLESVLLGDDLAAKVRAAFDAYIFLSYRKKDRKYAQELMRLIHKNPFCRDIAIWYDEFLTPGENFNDAIRDAMEKSRLFAMVVTPNLVNEVNYVMTTEYPKAAEAEMPILPAQMVDTDRKALAEAYPGIDSDHVTDAHDESALREALAGALSDGPAVDPSMEPGDTAAGNLSETAWKRIHEIALAETDRKEDPQHLFFMGLAYLGGIDVEVNQERAGELIERAADAGLAEAVQKLVSMYRNGEGVPRNYDTAIRWQEKLTDLYLQEYANDPTEETGQTCFLALRDLGDFNWELRKVERTWKVYQQALKFAGALDERFDDETSRWTLSAAYDRLGDVCFMQKDLKQARSYYEQDLDLCLREAKESGTEESFANVGAAYDNIGAVYLEEGMLGEARRFFEAGLRISEALLEAEDTIGRRRGLCIAYDNLGDLCKAEGDLKKAGEYYGKSLRLRQKIDAEVHTAESRKNLAISCQRISSIYEQMEDREKARQFCEISLQISEELAEETETVDSRRNIGVLCERLGGIFISLRNFGKAWEYAQRSLRLREQLAEETGTADSRRDLSVACMKCGEILMDVKKYEEARDYMQRSLDICMELAEETKTIESGRDLCVIYGKLGGLSECLGEADEVRKNYENGYLMAEFLAEQTEMAESRLQLGAFCNLLGSFFKKQGDLVKAREYYEKGVEVGSRLVDETGTPMSCRMLLYLCEDMTRLCYAEGKREESENYYRKVLQIRKRLAEMGIVVE